MMNMKVYGDLIRSLNTAFQTSKVMPRTEQKEFIGQYLCFLLKNQTNDQVLQFITQVRQQLNSSRVSSVSEELELIDKLFKRHDRAVENAALKAFDRFLQAMDPELINTCVDKKVQASSMNYKNAVFEAYNEKFQRLKLYNDKGRLAKEFRLSFLANFKQEFLARCS